MPNLRKSIKLKDFRGIMINYNDKALKRVLRVRIVAHFTVSGLF